MEYDQADLNTSLHLAVQRGSLTQVEKLIEAGADIHFFDELSFSALHYSVKSGNRQIVHFLLEQGADVNAHNADCAGETAIILAAENGYFGIAKLLLGFGADPYIGGWMQIDALDRAEMRKDARGERIKDLILMQHPPSKKRAKLK